MLAKVDGKAKGLPNTIYLHAQRLFLVFWQRPITIIPEEKRLARQESGAH
jgi:hypothetical protein